MKLLKKFFQNDYLFSVFIKVQTVILGLLYTVFFNRYLGTYLRGEAAYILSIVNILGIVLGFGIHQAYPHYRKIRKQNFEKEFCQTIFLMFIIYVIVALGAAMIVGGNLTIIAIVIITPMAVLMRQLNYIMAIEYPRKRNIVEIIINFLDLVVLIFLTIFTTSNYVFMLGILIFKNLIWIIISLILMDLSIFKINFNIKLLLKYIKFGIAPMIALLMMTLNYRVDVLMLRGFVDSSQLGIYSLGVQLAEKTWIFPEALEIILRSRLTKGKSNTEVSRVIRYSCLGCIIMIIFVALLGEGFISLIFGNEFKEAYQVTLILLYGVIGMIFYKMIATYNIINNRQRLNIILLSISVISNVILNLFLIPAMGIKGAAISSVISYSLCGALFLFFFSKDTGITIREILMFDKEDCNILKEIFNKLALKIRRG